MTGITKLAPSVMRVRLARLGGVLGREITCDDHGLIAWCRAALVHPIIAMHVRETHTLDLGGSSSRAIALEYVAKS